MHEKSVIETLVRSEDCYAEREPGNSGQVVERMEKRGVAGDYRICCRAHIRKVGAVEAIEISRSRRLES